MCADVCIHAQKGYSICCQVHKPVKASTEEEQDFDASHVVEAIQEKARQKSGLIAAKFVSTTNAQHGKEAAEITSSSSTVFTQDQNIQSTEHPDEDPIISSTDSCGYESIWQSNPDAEPPMDSSQQMESNQFAGTEVNRSFEDTNRDWNVFYTGDQHPESYPYSSSSMQPFYTNTSGCDVQHKVNPTGPQEWNWDMTMYETNEIGMENHSDPQTIEASFGEQIIAMNAEETREGVDGKNPNGMVPHEPFAPLVQLDSLNQPSEIQSAAHFSRNRGDLDSSGYCYNEDEEVPIARDSSQIKSVCGIRRAPPIFPHVPIQRSAEVHASQPWSENGKSAVSSDLIQSDVHCKEKSEGLEGIVHDLSARLKMVESELEITKKELKVVRYSLQFSNLIFII